MPRDHFHGPTFHALLHEYRAENSAAAKRLREEKQAEEEAAAAAALQHSKAKTGGKEEEEEEDGEASSRAATSTATAEEVANGGVSTAGGSVVGVEGVARGVRTGKNNNATRTGGVSPPPSSRIPEATPATSTTAGGAGTSVPGVPGAIPVAIPQTPAPRTMPTRTTTPTTAKSGAPTPPSTTPAEPKVALPIDAYRDEILEHVRNNRVTVIHGETGSGKSTRIPVMLVEEALDLIAKEAAAVAEAVREGLDSDRTQEGAVAGGGEGGGDKEGGSSSGRSSDSGSVSGGADKAPRVGSGGVRRPRMFVSQPRRAATRALVQRVRQEAKSSGRGWGVGLRLGHGVREGPPKAEVTFATTGYLARLLASNPGVLDTHTHLIIDEVSEVFVVCVVVCVCLYRHRLCTVEDHFWLGYCKTKVLHCCAANMCWGPVW